MSTDPNDGFCLQRGDKTHCVHWWDGDKPCCSCGHNEPAVDQRPKVAETDTRFLSRILGQITRNKDADFQLIKGADAARLKRLGIDIPKMVREHFAEKKK